jgi:hypothetical protein
MQMIRAANLVIAVSGGDTEVEKTHIIEGIKRLIECLCPDTNGVKKRTDFRKSHKKGAVSMEYMCTYMNACPSMYLYILSL